MHNDNKVCASRLWYYNTAYIKLDYSGQIFNIGQDNLQN